MTDASFACEGAEPVSFEAQSMVFQSEGAGRRARGDALCWVANTCRLCWVGSFSNERL